MTGKSKKEVMMNKEKLAEDCCFLCKDDIGGELMICDYKDCLKCFHPYCVENGYSILESDTKWKCDRHTCFRCLKSSPYLYCYTCKISVCRQCLPAVNFFQIKGKYGFCDFCRGLVLLIEEKRIYDSDGEKVDITDVETSEYFFVGYYHSIKEKEGFELRDLYAAIERAKIKKKRQSKSDLEEVEEEEEEEEEEDEEDEDEEYHISDSDGIEDERNCKRLDRENRSNKKENILEGKESEEEYHLSDYDGIEDESNCKRLDRENRSNKKENILEGKESEETHSEEAKNGQPASEMNVIELLDSDDENGKFDDVKRERWCIRGPYGDQREKCSLSVLRKWSEVNAYASNFKVWRDDENEENAIWLLEAISTAFPEKSKEDTI